MKPLHTAVLVLGVMLSSCGYVQTGPTTGDASSSETLYETCLRSSAVPYECADDKRVRDFTYQFAFHSEVLCQPGARTLPNKLE